MVKICAYFYLGHLAAVTVPCFDERMIPPRPKTLNCPPFFLFLCTPIVAQRLYVVATAASQKQELSLSAFAQLEPMQTAKIKNVRLSARLNSTLHSGRCGGNLCSYKRNAPLAPHINVDNTKTFCFFRSAMAPSNIEIGGGGDLTVVHGICSYELTMVGVLQHMNVGRSCQKHSS